MTENAFEALWFLYHITKRDLGKMAGKGASKTSILTHFNTAIHSALHRSNDTDTFLRSLEKTAGLNFDKFDEYPHEFPAREAFDALFKELKKHSLLSYMPQLVERARQEKALDEPETESNSSQETTQ